MLPVFFQCPRPSGAPQKPSMPHSSLQTHSFLGKKQLQKAAWGWGDLSAHEPPPTRLGNVALATKGSCEPMRTCQGGVLPSQEPLPTRGQPLPLQTPAGPAMREAWSPTLWKYVATEPPPSWGHLRARQDRDSVNMQRLPQDLLKNAFNLFNLLTTQHLSRGIWA